MKAEDFIVSILATNSFYNSLVQEGFINEEEFKKRVIEKYNNPEYQQLFKSSGIVPHPLHGDSPALEDAFYNLVSSTKLRRWTGGDFNWNFPVKPQEYFNREIKPNLSETELKKLEELAGSLA